MEHPAAKLPPRPALSALLLLVCAAAVGSPAWALPRYAALYGQRCALCHVNPTGGGMRTLYASQFLVPEEIAARGWPDSLETGVPSPELTPNVTIGTDLRTLAYQAEQGTGSTFAMQGDLYLDLQLGPAAFAYLEQGLSTSGEIFGVIGGLPLTGYLKAGRFVPDFGWRFADHQMFNRRYALDDAGSDNPAFLYDSGLELGIAPGPLTMSASLLSDGRRQGDGYAARTFLRQEWGGVRLGVGASILRRTEPAGYRRLAGGLWYVGIGPVVWLGEADETSRPAVDAAGRRLGNVVAQELAVRVARGWDVRVTYGFLDPDRARRSGARHRYGAGLAVMPRPWFALQLMGNRYENRRGPDVTEAGRYEGELMLHFFY